MTDLGVAPTYTDVTGKPQQADGVFGALEIESDSGIAYASPEWFALGLDTRGAFVVNKFGRDPDIDTGTVPEDVWNGGGVYTGFPTGAAENIQVFSSSASDTGTLTISGLDANYDRVSRTVTLSGTTPVTVSGGTMARVHTASYDTASATTFNVGTITVRHATTTANVFLSMAPGRSQSNASAYTVPNGFRAILMRASGAILGGTSAAVDGSFWVREFGKSPRMRRPFAINQTTQFRDDIFGGIVLPAKTDIIARVTECTANNVAVTVRYDLLVIPVT